MIKITRKKGIIGGTIAALAIALTLTACGQPSGQQIQAKAQAQDTKTLETNQPTPHFNYSQARQNLIDIETAEANDVQTTTFWMNMGNPDPIGSCPSIGFGIPDSASLTNPLQLANPGDSQSTALGQEDPTGYYAPTSSAGTFIICLTANGQPYIDRIESNVDTYGGPAQWDYNKHMGVMVGAPTASAKQVVSPTMGGTK